MRVRCAFNQRPARLFWCYFEIERKLWLHSYSWKEPNCTWRQFLLWTRSYNKLHQKCPHRRAHTELLLSQRNQHAIFGWDATVSDQGVCRDWLRSTKTNQDAFWTNEKHKRPGNALQIKHSCTLSNY